MVWLNVIFSLVNNDVYIKDDVVFDFLLDEVVSWFLLINGIRGIEVSEWFLWYFYRCFYENFFDKI